MLSQVPPLIFFLLFLFIYLFIYLFQISSPERIPSCLPCFNEQWVKETVVPCFCFSFKRHHRGYLFHFIACYSHPGSSLFFFFIFFYFLKFFFEKNLGGGTGFDFSSIRPQNDVIEGSLLPAHGPLAFMQVILSAILIPILYLYIYIYLYFLS